MKSNENKFEKASKKEGKGKKNIWLTAGSIIILVLSAIAFIFIPSIGGFAKTGDTIEFGKYDGKPIEYGYGTDFLAAVQETADLYQQYYQQQGMQLDQSSYLYIFYEAFQRVVLNRMYEANVAASGYTPAENAVKREMVRYFLDENGNYSAKKFREASESYKKELSDSLTKSLVSARFTTDYLGRDLAKATDRLYGLKNGTAEGDFIASLRSKSRNVQMVSFQTSEYPDSEVVSYGKSNSTLFTQYDLSAITASTEEELKSIKDKIEKNEITFDDAAANLSKKSYCDDDGKFTSKYAYQIQRLVSSDEDFRKITTAAKGSVTDIIKITSGYAMFRCDGPSAAADMNDDETLSIVRNYISMNEQGIIDDYFTGLASSFAANAAKSSFEEAAAAAGVEVKELTNVAVNIDNHLLLPMNYFSTFAELQGAESNTSLFKAIFSLKQNEISAPVMNGNNVLVFKLLSEDVLENEMDLSYMMNYYLTSYIQEDFSNNLLKSDKIENNVIGAYFDNFYN